MEKLSYPSLLIMTFIARTILSYDFDSQFEKLDVDAAIKNWTASITEESTLTQEIRKVVQMNNFPDCSLWFDKTEPANTDFMNSIASIEEMLEKRRVELKKVIPNCSLWFDKTEPANVHFMNSLHTVEELLEKRRGEMEEVSDKYIHQIVSSRIHVAALRGNSEIASYLLGKNGDPYLPDAEGRTPLHIAAFKGNLAIVKLILNRTADGINIRDQFGATPLFLASYNNRFEVCDLLLQYGADPGIAVSDGRTSLHLAAEKGHLTIATLLIRHKKEIINLADVNRETALHTAAANNRYSVTKVLMEQGADLQARNMISSTPLHLAVEKGHRDIVDIITLNDTLHVNVENDEGLTPLNLATYYNNSEIFFLLMSRGGDPNVPTRSLTFPLHFAASKNNVEIIRHLISSKDVKIDVQDEDGRTPVYLAATKDNRISLKFLLSNNASTLVPRRNGATPLHVAIIKRHIQIINIILSYSSISVNSVDDDNMSPLYYATRYNNSIICTILLKSGADPYIADKFGNTPLHFAVRKNNIEILENMLSFSSAGINKRNLLGHTALHMAVDLERTPLVKELLDHGAYPYLGDKSNWTPLHFAVNNSDFVNTALILSKDTSGIDYKTKSGYTALFLLAARRNNDTKLYKVLLDSGANPFIQNRWNSTLVHLVSDLDNVEVAKLTLRLRNEINVQTTEGVTPLILAVSFNRSWITTYFLDEGADPNLPDVHGRVALHYAAQDGNVNIVKILLDNPATNINPQDINGSTPLFATEVYNQSDMLIYLLKRGADPNIKSFSGKTLLHEIVQEGKINMAMKLIGKVNINDVTNNGLTALSYAVIYNHYLLFNILLHLGADPNIPDDLGHTCLHRTALNCFPDFIEAILAKNKSSLNIPDLEGNTPLMTSIQEKCISTEYFLQQGADPFEKNSNGHIAIHMAALYENIEACDLLLDVPGISIDSLDITHYTPLILAGMYGNTDMVVHLLERGANPCLISKMNTSVLHYTCGESVDIFNKIFSAVAEKCDGKVELDRQEAQGNSPLSGASDAGNEDVFFYLIEKGAKPFVSNYQGRTLLHVAAIGGNLNIMSYLTVNASISVNSLTMSGETPLMFAARRGDIRAFNFLSELGADKNYVTKYGETVLHSAAYGGNVEIMEKLLQESKMNIDGRDFEGNTPLMYAVKEQHLDMTSYLIQKNVDLLAQNVYGDDALRWAASGGNLSLVLKFPQAFESIDSLLGIIISSNNARLNPDMLEFLLERSSLANNSLFMAAALGDDDTLYEIFQHERRFEKKGFPNLLREFTKEYEDLLEDVLEEEQNFPSYRAFLTPLDVAILFFGKISTVKILIDNLNINITETKRKSLWTPLELACISTGIYDIRTTYIKESIFHYLLNSARSLVNHTDKFGWNIVHKAAWVGNSRVIYALYKYGADINKLDNYGRTPLHIAALKGFYDTVKHLLFLSDKCINCYDIYGFTPLHLTQIYRIQKFFKKYSQTTITLDTGLRYKLLQQVDLISRYQKSFRRQDPLVTMSFLLRAKADINIQDKTFHWTPLHWAAASGDFNTTAFLVARGAKINIPSKRGQTPMYLARYWGRKDIYYYLKSINGIW